MRGGRWLALAAVGAAIFWMMDLSWLRWGDLLIDTGRELSVPQALAEGKLLYRDVFYIYGPFSPCFNALLYKLFGVHILTAAASGFLSLLAVSYLLYRLAAAYLDRFFATFTVVAFVLVFAFSFYTPYSVHSYVLPYAFPAVHGLALCLAGMWAFRRHLVERGRWDLALTGLFLFLALLTKVEMGGALFLALGAGMALREREGGATWGVAGGRALLALAWPLAAAALVYGAFDIASEGRFVREILAGGQGAALRPWEGFAARVLGVDELGPNLAGLAARAAQWVALGALFAGGGVLLGRCSRIPVTGRRVEAAGAIGLGILSLAVLLCSWPPSLAAWQPFPSWFAPLPLLSLAVLPALARKEGEQGLSPGDRAFLASLALLSLLFLSRILLRAGAAHFGSYLVVPGFLLSQIVLFRMVPDRLPSPLARTVFRGAFAGVLLLVVAGHQVWLRNNYAAHTLEVSSSRGTLFFREWETPLDNRGIRDLIAYLSGPGRAGRSLVVFPEGQTINFFAGLANPLYHNVYLPVDLASPAAVAALLADLERKMPDYLVETARPLDEYGAHRFRDYAAPVIGWAVEKYEMEKDFGGAAVLYRRKGLPLP